MIEFKTRRWTEASWREAHDETPLPLEAYGEASGQIWQRQKQTKKQRQRDWFDRHYDKLKTVQFKDPDELSMNKYFYMPRLELSWSFDSLNALAIYPVFCGRADFRVGPFDDKNWVRISRENIGRYAGISTPSVDKGVSDLLGANFIYRKGQEEISTPFLQRREWRDGKRRGWEYMPGFYKYGIDGIDPHQWKGRYFAFHTCIVNSGVWSELSRKAKALYLAMRSKAFFDQQAYEHIEGVYIPTFDEIYGDPLVPEPEKGKFRLRKWDVCDRPLTELFKLARVYYQDTKEIVEELEMAGLVEKAHETKSIFKVYLKPMSLKT